MRMLSRFVLPGRSRSWNSVEVAADGSFIGASVTAARGGRRAKVTGFARSSGVAMGVNALHEVAAKLPAAQWTTVLARDDYQMLVVPEPPVLDTEIQSTLRWTLAGVIEYPAAEAAVSWMRIPTATYNAAAERQMYAVVARQSIVKERSDLFAKARIPLRAVDVRETALRNIAAAASREGDGVALISVSNAGVSTIFTFRGELYLDRFISQPIDDIASDDTRRRRFLDRLATQVNQSMELLERNFPFVNLERILVAPAETDIGIVHHLSPIMSIPVEALDLSKVFDMSATPQLQDRQEQGRYLVALGTALRGMR
jgi:MSHA biogenesis protein MshI